MSTDIAIFLAVLLARLLVPLFIPRFPLPAILAALVIDAADQTIFQNTTDLDLTGYQGYDKALDIYYLTIAYLSTIRNWTDPFAFRVGQFLWYWRLVGVLLFELTEVRALLLIFPNTFEYFFIAYEAVRLWWNPERLTRRQVVGMAAFIWIFIKLPQEWWIHIAQLDFTDFMKEDVFGVTVDTPWGTALAENPWFIALMVVVVAVVAVVARALWRRAPEPDWSFTVDVDATLDRSVIPVADREPPRILSWYMFEKIALVAMVTAIFAQVLPDTESDHLAGVLLIPAVIIVNAFVSFAIARSGHRWTTTTGEFFAMSFLNIGIALVYGVLFWPDDADVNVGASLFFLLLLTLIVTMFDRYHRQIPRPVAGPGSLRTRRQKPRSAG